MNPDDLPLIYAFLACSVLGFATPALWLSGESGAGKSSVGQGAQSVFHPLRGSAKDGVPLHDERSLIAAVYGKPVLNLGNMSGVSLSLSDSLCRVITGAQVSLRAMYKNLATDDFEVQRVLIVTSIAEGFLQGDLRTRLLKVEVPPFKGTQLSDREWWTKVLDYQPTGVGAVADLVSQCLRLWDDVGGPSETRLGDYERVLRVVDRLFGTKAEERFVKHQRDHIAQQAEDDPFLTVLLVQLGVKFGRTPKVGQSVELTTTDLLADCAALQSASSRVRGEWPDTTPKVAAAIKRGAGALRLCGYDSECLGQVRREGQKVSVWRFTRTETGDSDEDLGAAITT